MSVPFAHRQLADGTVEFDLLGPWTTEAASVFAQSGATSLVLNQVRGFVADDLEFLGDLSLRRLEVLTYQPYDVTPIYALSHSLTSLSFGRHATPIDLTRLPGLTDLSCDWACVEDSIASGGQLIRAALTRFSATDLTPLSDLRTLRTLHLKDRPRVTTLRGLEPLQDLVTVEIAGAPLAALGDIAGLVGIRRLSVPGSKQIEDIDAIRGMSDLRALDIADCKQIRTIAPLRDKARLESLSAYGTTTVDDGDLTPLVTLPRLRELSMMSRRHYSPSVDRIQAHIAQLNRSG